VIYSKASKLRSRLRALQFVAVAAAAATFGVIYSKASKLRSRLRALKFVAVAAAAATFGVIYTRASESEASRERSELSRALMHVASAQAHRERESLDAPCKSTSSL
jgi:hypothetical protein